MAEIEEVLATRLTSFAGLTALIGDRVYPEALPQQATLPAITYQIISGTREHGMTADHGLAHPRIQLDVWSATYASGAAVARQVKLALQRWQDATTNPEVLDVFIDNELTFPEDELDDATRTMRRRLIDLIVWHRE